MNPRCVSLRSDSFFRLWRLAPGLCAGLALAALPVRAADSAAPGSIAGSVFSKSTRNALQGAVVSLPGLNRTVLTDNAGQFLIPQVPAGAVELVISYNGFDTVQRTVSVPYGDAARVEVELQTAETIVMDAFTVASVREGQALSITEQRNAENIKNVAALDEWGNLPTLSIAELAMRLPGISFTTNEDNVVSNVSIRGLGSEFTRLNIDGMLSTGVGGDGRSATLHSFSGAMYEQIEIIAGQTPDKRADSLGGQLNLKTRSPLSMRERRRFNYNVSARWAPPFAERTPQLADHPLHPVGSLNYQEVFDVFGGRRNFGLALNASHAEGVNAIPTDILGYQSTTDPVAYFNDYQNITGLNYRMVTGLSLRADYRSSPRSLYSFRFLYNAGSEPFYDRTRVEAWSASTLATIGANGQLSATGAVLPGYSENRTAIRPIAASRMDLEMWRFSFTSKNPTATIAGENNLGRLKLDYAARFSNTHYHSGAGREHQGGQLTMRAEPIGFVLDRSNLDGRVFTQLSGPNVYDPASYTANLVFTKRDSVSDTNEASANIHASYNLPTSVPLVVKTGLDTVNRRVNARQVLPQRWNRTAGAGPLTGSLMALTRFEEQHDGQRLPVFDPVSINSQLSNAALWTEDLNYAAQQPYTSRRLLEEAVDAGYLQAQAKLGRLVVLGGARVEDVKVDTFTYVKYRSTSTAAEPDPVKRAKLDYGAATSEGHYTKVFPSVHLSYDITANLKARASWSNSYGRPFLANLIPAVTFNDQQQTVTAGNPSLKPQLGRNLDAKLEYYFASNGVVTLGAFNKKITDYIVTREFGTVENGPDNGFEGNYGGYTLSAPVNMGSAEVTGVEFEFRQRLAFLPGQLKGLTLAANYTWLKTKGKFTGTTELTTKQVAGFVPRAGNVRLLYGYKRFGASASLNFTGEYVVSYLATAPANSYYRKDLTTVNLGFSYRLRPDATFFVDASNIFEHGPEQYRYIYSRLRQRTLGMMSLNLGVNGQF